VYKVYGVFDGLGPVARADSSRVATTGDMIVIQGVPVPQKRVYQCNGHQEVRTRWAGIIVPSICTCKN
jgi:hypothetical protein